MKNKTLIAISFATALVTSVLASTHDVEAQKRITIQATAQGTSTQIGRMAGLNLIINEFSTAEDQKALIVAFGEKGSEGVANALNKMHSKGRISLTGTLGYDVNYIREFKLPNGVRKIRIVTDRPIAFGELWSSSRSQDYNLSAAEFILSPEKGKSEGTLLPACQFKIDKDNELNIETFQNPWKLVNVQIR